MAYFTEFNNSFISTDNQSVSDFLDKLYYELTLFNIKVNHEGEKGLFLYFGSTILNTYSAINYNGGYFFLSDIDGLCISKTKNPDIDLINKKGLNIDSNYFQNSIKVSIKHIEDISLIHAEDFVFFNCIKNNLNNLKSNNLVPFQHHELKLLDEIKIKNIPYEILLPLWAIVKFLMMIDCSPLSIIKAKYELSKGLRNKAELSHSNKSKGIYIISTSQLDNYIIEKYSFIKNFLMSISDSLSFIELIDKMWILINDRGKQIEFPYKLKTTCLNIILEYIHDIQLNSLLHNYIRDYLKNEPHSDNKLS